MKAVADILARDGLMLRGCLDFDADEARPDGPAGRPAGAVLLVGTAGAAWWTPFRRWLDRRPDVPADPLDTWSRAIIERAATACGGLVAMPGDRPFMPFQRWAMRAEGLKPSPVGLLIHPRYGLWHAYRGAILLDRRIASRQVRASNHPCDACAGKPCLNACPVGAYSGHGFAHGDCLAHVRGADGGTCRDRGCLARNACPVGARWRYPAEVQAFHQRAFAGG